MRHLFVASLLLFGLGLQAQELWPLDRCISQALANNIQVQQSRLNRDIQEVNLQQTRMSRLPNLNLGATHGYNWGQTIDPFTNQFATDRVRNNNFFLSSGVTLFNGFQINNTIKQNQETLLAQELEVQAMENDISLMVAQSYLNVLFSQEQVRSVQAQLSISQRQVDRMQRMVDAGQMALADLYDIQAQFASDKLSVAQAENALMVNRLQLGNMLLLSPEQLANMELIAPDAAPEESDIPEVGVIYAAASSKLPQNKAAELRVQSSETGIDVAKGAMMPSLELRGSVGTGYSGNNILPVGDPIVSSQAIGIVESSQEVVVAPAVSFDSFETKAFDEQLDDNFNQSLSFSLNLPIFNGYQVKSSVSRAKLNYELSRLNALDVSNTLLQNVQQARTDLIAARRNYEAATESLKALELTFSNAEKRMEQEMISIIDFNDTKARLSQAEIGQIRAKYDLLFRTAVIDFYLGRDLQIN